MNHNGREICFCSQCQKALRQAIQGRGNAPKNQNLIWAVLEQRSKETKASRALARN